MAPSVQRRIENAKQSLKGRSPYVFEVRLVPQSAGKELAIRETLQHYIRCQGCCAVLDRWPRSAGC